jgi:stage III sporulation protein AD
MVLGDVIPLLGTVRSLFVRSGLPSEYMQIVLKALGICLLTQLASDACRDAGEQGLANKVDLVGKATLLTMAIPLFERVGGMAVALMERS